VLTHLSPTYDAMRNPETDFGLEAQNLKVDEILLYEAGVDPPRF
jgi:hypothetical protein